MILGCRIVWYVVSRKVKRVRERRERQVKGAREVSTRVCQKGVLVFYVMAKKDKDKDQDQARSRGGRMWIEMEGDKGKQTITKIKGYC